MMTCWKDGAFMKAGVRGFVVGRCTAVATVAAAFVILSTPAHSTPISEPLADGVEQVVVTAQKREQRVQDVPISISVLTSEQIENSGRRDFGDLVLALPGVSSSASQPGLTRYSIRGISTQATNATVGLYVDDVSLITLGNAFSGAANPMLFDLDRIEVLKGPQGTLYGGSTLGGAIKFVTHKPTLDAFSADVAGSLGTVEQGGLSDDVDSFVNVPLVPDHLAVRLSGAYRSDAGYINNIPNGEVEVGTRSATLPPAPFVPVRFRSGSTFAQDHFNNRTTRGARLSALWLPYPGWRITPIVTIQRSDQPNPNEFFTNLPALQNTARLKQPTRDDLHLYSLEIVHTRDYVELTLLAGYTRRRLELDRDFSLFVGMLVPGLLGNESSNVTVTRTDTSSQELRLASADRRARWRWTTGVYHQHQLDEYDQLIIADGGGAFFGTGTDRFYGAGQVTHASQLAAFADSSYRLGSRWELSAGARWFDIRQEAEASTTAYYAGVPAVGDGSRSVDVGAISRAAISYRLPGAQLLYASASKGFRPGGPNLLAIDSPVCAPDLARLGLAHAPLRYQSDRLWTYELGSKNTFAGMVVNAAVFYTDWKRIQQQVFLPTCALQFAGNVGAATVRGAELAVETPRVGRTSAGGSFAYNATRITAGAPGVSAQVGEPLLDTPRLMLDLHGQYELGRWVHWATALRAEYQFHGANLRQFESLLNVSYPDGTSGQIPDDTQVQHGYHVVNGSLVAKKGSMELRLFVDNMFDAQPFLDYRRVPGFSAATTLTPRTVGFSVRVGL
jgi:iron complex outermembrane recepter protein